MISKKIDDAKRWVKEYLALARLLRNDERERIRTSRFGPSERLVVSQVTISDEVESHIPLIRKLKGETGPGI